MHLFSSPTDQVSGGLMRGNTWRIEIDLFKVIASHRISATPSVPNCARDSFESLYGCIEQKEGRKKNTPAVRAHSRTHTHTAAPNESWIIPGAKGSIAARLSPRSSIWFISLPSALRLGEELSRGKSFWCSEATCTSCKRFVFSNRKNKAAWTD